MEDDSWEQPGIFPVLHNRTTNTISIRWTYVQDNGE